MAAVRPTVQDLDCCLPSSETTLKKSRSAPDIASVATPTHPARDIGPTNVWLKLGKAAITRG